MDKRKFTPPPSSTQRRQGVANSGALARVLGRIPPSSASDAVTEVQAAGEEVIHEAASEQRGSVRPFPSATRAKVDPKICRPWRLADRPDGDFGDLSDLGSSLFDAGQVQASLVRPIAHPGDDGVKFEVIAGVRRWRAARIKAIDLEVVIKQMDDREAFVAMAAENDKRQPLSAYGLGCRYLVALKEGFFADQKALAEWAGVDKGTMSRYLAIAQLNRPIVKAAGDDIGKLGLRLLYELFLCQAEHEGEIVRDMADLVAGKIRLEDVPAIWKAAPVEKKPARVSERTTYRGINGKRIHCDVSGSAVRISGLRDEDREHVILSVRLMLESRQIAAQALLPDGKAGMDNAVFPVPKGRRR